MSDSYVKETFCVLSMAVCVHVCICVCVHIHVCVHVHVCVHIFVKGSATQASCKLFRHIFLILKENYI